MLNQLKEKDFYNHDPVGPQHDAHVKDYESQNMGVKVVFCNSRGVPVSNSVAPLSSYFPNTSYNM